jgi:hypothetical protein
LLVSEVSGLQGVRFRNFSWLHSQAWSGLTNFAEFFL